VKIFAPQQASATTGSPTETSEGGGVYSYYFTSSGSITF
jgi:hypothetical protein